MFPYLSNPTEQRFPISIGEAQDQYCTKKRRCVYRYLFLTRYKENTVYPSRFFCLVWFVSFVGWLVLPFFFQLCKFFFTVFGVRIYPGFMCFWNILPKNPYIRIRAHPSSGLGNVTVVKCFSFKKVLF